MVSESSNGVSMDEESAQNSDINHSTHSTHSTDDRIQISTMITVQSHPHCSLALTMICIALVMSFFLSSLDTTIATAIPRIVDDFGALDDTVWYGSAFFISLGAFQSSWGKVFKCCNLKYAFFTAILLFELGSLLCAVAPNSNTLIVGRSIAGTGAAGIGSGAFIVFAFAADPSWRPLFAATIGITYGVASVLGPIVGGALTDNVSWRWCFYINLPAGALAVFLLFVFFRAPDTNNQSWKDIVQQMDILGVALTVGALISYILALQFGGLTRPWNSSIVIGLLVGSGALSVTLILWEMHAKEDAMVVPRLFAKRHIHTSCLFSSCLAGSYFVAIYYLPIYFQSVSNVTPTISAVRNLPLIIAVSGSMVLSAFFVSKTGHVVQPMAIGACIATIGAGMLYTLDSTTAAPKWIGYQILGGAGWGLAFQIPIFVCQSNAAASDLASITATVLFFLNIGGAVFLSAAHAVFANRLLISLYSIAPQLDPTFALATGPTPLREKFPPDEIVSSYMFGLKGAFMLSIAGAGCASVATLRFKLERLQNLGLPLEHAM